MKRALLVCAGLTALFGTISATTGCATVQKVNELFLKGEVLTYEKYLSVDQAASPPPKADTVISTLGMPMAVHDRDGVRRRIDYHCYSLTGEMKIAEFQFDEHENLVKKELW
jgi:hypothetical protein